MKKHIHHNNCVRIVAGLHRGRKIGFPDVAGLRPTPDSVRERLFNWLGQDLTGQTVLDLFAGSGALGLESASRHASQVYQNDQHPLIVAQLKKNIQQLNLQGKVHVSQNDAIGFLQSHTHQFDLVFLDPPFVWQEWDRLFEHLKKCLKPQAFVYVEAGKIPNFPAYLTVHRQGKAGQSQFVLLQYQETEQCPIIESKNVIITIYH